MLSTYRSLRIRFNIIGLIAPYALHRSGAIQMQVRFNVKIFDDFAVNIIYICII